MAVPDERDFGEVNRERYSLVPHRMQDVGGWLFVNGDEAALPATEALGEGGAWLAGCDRDLRFVDRNLMRLNSNWKGVVERLADLVENPGTRNAETVSLMPNVLIWDFGQHVRMLAAWPLDERTTELEVVRCRRGTASAAPIRSLNWEIEPDAKLRAALDLIPLSGAKGAASRQRAIELAAEVRRTTRIDSLEAAKLSSRSEHDVH
jgi:hypothetical protein